MVIILQPILVICCFDFLSSTRVFFDQHQPYVKYRLTLCLLPSHSAPEFALLPSSSQSYHHILLFTQILLQRSHVKEAKLVKARDNQISVFVLFLIKSTGFTEKVKICTSSYKKAVTTPLEVPPGK